MLRFRQVFLIAWLILLSLLIYYQSDRFRLPSLNLQRCQNGTCLESSQVKTINQQVASIEGAPNQIKEEIGPSKLDYPPGFEKYDTADPDSPYHKDTYDLTPTQIDLSDSPIPIHQLNVSQVLELLSFWVPYASKYSSFNPIIWQTNRGEPSISAGPYGSWTMNAPKYTRHFITDDTIPFILSGIPRKLEFLKVGYERLKGAMKWDFLRYLEMFRDGGIYTDFDTECLVPIDEWYASCYPSNTINGKPVPPAKRPGLLVGIEFDVGTAKAGPIQNRSIALANYVFGASKGHPVFAEMITSIIASVQGDPLENDLETIYATTGRRIWTDTIIRHIQRTTRGFSERSLFRLQKAQVFGDICILPINAFGLGQRGYENFQEAVSENGAFVKHFFMKSWM